MQGKNVEPWPLHRAIAMNLLTRCSSIGNGNDERSRHEESGLVVDQRVKRPVKYEIRLLEI